MTTGYSLRLDIRQNSCHDLTNDHVDTTSVQLEVRNIYVLVADKSRENVDN